MQYKVVQSTILYPETVEVNKVAKPLDTYKNLEWLLGHFKAVIKFNLMTRKREIYIPDQYVFPDDIENDSLSRVDYIATLNLMPTKKLDAHLDVLAGENAYHPIVDCILKKPWDQKPRLESFVSCVRTNNQNTSNEVIKTWMTSAIAAAFSTTGFINQGVLVFQGEQGIGKSSWVKALDPIGCSAVKESAFLDPTNKDSVAQLASYWISELGELESIFKKSDIGRLKSFVTMEFDYVRLPYAKKPVRLSRRSAYVATVNDENFLSDETGNRRWWTIKVKEINLNHGLDMQQVWAEVYQLWQDGKDPYLSKDLQFSINSSNREHEKLDPFKEKLMDNYDWESTARRFMSATAILNELGYSHPTKADTTKMSILLKEINKAPAKKSNGQRLHQVPYFITPKNHY